MNQIRPLPKQRQICPLASRELTDALTLGVWRAIPPNQAGIAGRDIAAFNCGSTRRHRGKQMTELCNGIADSTSNPQGAPALRWRAEPSLTSSVDGPLFGDVWCQTGSGPNAFLTERAHKPAEIAEIAVFSALL